jgi:DNA-directed RNA polymerase specialized sigma24 family protein
VEIVKSWNLTEGSLQGLLAFLDADRARAAVRYEEVRQKLVRFFEWKGCIPGDEFADEAIDRVARRVEAGFDSPPENPYLFFHGVAVNIVREKWRKNPLAPKPLDELRPSESPLFQAQPHEPPEPAAECRLACLSECLDRLPPTSREMLREYHLGGSGVHIGRRQSLAERLHLPAGALRLRVFRIRRQLQRCMTECVVKRPENVTSIDERKERRR